MLGSRSVSVKTSVRMTLLGVMLTIVASALISHEFLRASDARRTQAVAATMAARTAAPNFSAVAAPTQETLDAACSRLIESPNIRAVGVWSQAGNLIAHRAKSQQLDTFLRRSAPPCGSCQAAPHLIQEGSNEGEPVIAYYASVRITSVPFGGEAAWLGVIVTPAEAVASPWPHMRWFCLPVVLIGLGAFCLGSWWLSREVVQPIGSLMQSGLEGHAPEAANFGRHRELGKIATLLSTLQTELTTWRQRAKNTERRMDRQIAEKTERISRALSRMRQEAWLDPLTRINNRRFLEEEFPVIFDAQSTTGNDLSVAMLDMDNFKILNDTQGHAAGDEVLRFAGELLRQCLRSDDIAVRYGGDEFALILPGMNVQSAQTMVQRLLTLFAQRARMMVDIEDVPTMTAGIASIAHNHPASPMELLGLADRALLQAKQAGKRQACISHAEGQGPTHRTTRSSPAAKPSTAPAVRL